MSLFECMTIELIVIYAENKLKEIMSAQKSIVYLVNKDELIRYTPEKTIILPNNYIGLIGQISKTQLPLIVNDPYANSLHNLLVDIDTNLPLLTLHVKSSDVRFCLNYYLLDKLLAIYQVINIKGGFGNITKNNTLEINILKNFSRMLAICLEKTKKIQKVIDNQVEKNERQQARHFLKKMSQQCQAPQSKLTTIEEFCYDSQCIN